jgi:hypothetical protein
VLVDLGWAIGSASVEVVIIERRIDDLVAVVFQVGRLHTARH